MCVAKTLCQVPAPVGPKTENRFSNPQAHYAIPPPPLFETYELDVSIQIKSFKAWQYINNARRKTRRAEESDKFSTPVVAASTGTA
jgi:hypothetical protein